MIKAIFNNQTKSITLAAYILAASSVVSAVLGLLRNALLSWRLGPGEDLDIYFAAFKIPDLAFGLLISGGVIAAFLPVFSEYFARDQKEAWHMTNIAINAFLLLMIVVCGILAIFTPQLTKLLVPGFSAESQALTVMLTRIMFLSPIFFGISNIFASILQYFRRFVVYALAPIMYNIGIIIGIVFFFPAFGLIGLAYGVILGAFLHWIIQLPAVLKIGFRYKAVLKFRYDGLRKIFALMIPRTIAATASHINVIIITAIASTLGAGSISVFNLAEHFRSLPIGIIGGSFAVAAFPFLARAWANNEREKFFKSFSSTVRQTLFLVVPLSVLIFLLRAQFIRLIYGRGEFGWLGTQLTAACLGLFCLGIFAYSLTPLLKRAFFSLQDTRTPLFISLFSVVSSASFAFLFVWLLKFTNPFHAYLVGILDLAEVSRVIGVDSVSVIGLPLALSLAGIIELVLLFVFLHKRVGDFRVKEIGNAAFKIILASAFLCFTTYGALRGIDRLVDTHTGPGLLIQTIVALAVGTFVYFLMARFLKLSEVETLRLQFLSLFKKPKIVPPILDGLPKVKEDETIE